MNLYVNPTLPFLQGIINDVKMRGTGYTVIA